MKTKTITKTFYVSDGCFELLSKNKVILTISDFKDDERGNEVQISWQEPEKTVTITEAEWDEVIKDTCYAEKSGWLADVLKKKLFDKKIGASDENKN